MLSLHGVEVFPALHSLNGAFWFIIDYDNLTLTLNFSDGQPLALFDHTVGTKNSFHIVCANT